MPRRIYCWGYVPFLSHLSLTLMDYHSYSTMTPVHDTLWTSYACTHISLITRAVTSLTRFSGRPLPIIMVGPFLFIRQIHFVDLHLPLTATPHTFLDASVLGPTPASIVFTPIYDFYDPYCDNFNQFGWINHRGIWSDHCTTQGH